MKSRIPYFTTVLLIILFGIVLFAFYTRSQEQERVLPATISRDCAPWDGAAFTVSIPYDSVSVITISICQSPDIKFPSTFSFPDNTIQVGNVSWSPQLGGSEQLTGEVWLRNVREGMPVEGRFSLMSESGERFKGKFVAEWESQIVYCG